MAPRWETDLEHGLARARAGGAKGVMVDVTASWCAPCKELARHYQTRTVRAALEGWVRVRIDVTENDEDDLAFQDRWSAHATPTVLFLTPDGTERARVEGLISANELAARVPR